uniref:phospholipase D-like domain-containing protein n=1 Tax=Gordonia sp. B7-2 TaxID=3420932 RepID=UPI003D933BAB
MAPQPREVTARAGDALFSALGTARQSVFLCSPYLTKDVAHKLARAATASTAEWQLLTKLDPVAIAGGYLSTQGLRELLDANVRIRNHVRLHAKAQLIDDDFGLIGSANLTSAGLGLAGTGNAELSLTLRVHEIAEARSYLNQWWELSANVDEAAIRDADRDAARLPIPSPLSSTEPQPDTLSLSAERLLADARDPSRALWIKAQYGDPNPNAWQSAHFFSSPKHRRPSIKRGDLVLIYAKNAHGCYAVVEVTDSATNDPDYVTNHSNGEEWVGERWPWVNHTIPRLTPPELVVITTDQLGVTGQGLQGGHKRLTLSEFASGVRLLVEGAQ